MKKDLILLHGTHLKKIYKLVNYEVHLTFNGLGYSFLLFIQFMLVDLVVVANMLQVLKFLLNWAELVKITSKETFMDVSRLLIIF